MVLSAVQIGLCFQSYWYMWLTTGLSGLLFIGIDIGIAAFFLNKFGKKKASNYQRPPSRVFSAKRPYSSAEITSLGDSYTSSALGHYGGHSASARSANVHGSLEDNDVFAQSALQAMNGARARYHAQPLDLNDQLSEIAQRWAEQMARNGKLEHSPAEWRSFGGQTLGENYSASFQAELTGDKMVKKWMKEGKRYMFGYDGRKDTENFTQLVWQSSHEVGVGRARSEDGNWWYGVVVFDPPGNIPNQYAPNVFLAPGNIPNQYAPNVFLAPGSIPNQYTPNVFVPPEYYY